MRLALKIIGWIVAGLIVLVIAIGLGFWFGGTPALAWVIKHPVSSMLGRQISIDGPMRLSWGNPSRIVVEDVHVANASWDAQHEMFSAKRLEIDLFVRSLISGPAHITRIALDGAKLLLEKSKQGQKNWQFGLSSAAPQKRHQFPVVNRIDIRDSELTYYNGVTDATSLLGIKALGVNEPNANDPIAFQATGSFQKAPLTLSGSVAPLKELRDTSKPYPVKLEGALADVRLAIDGTIKEPLDFNGLDMRLSMAGAKLQEVGDMLGVPLPPLPDFRGTSVLTGGDAHFALQALSLKAGKSDLEGGIDIDASKKVPQIKAQLTSNFVDLADFIGLAGAKPARSSAPAKPPSPSGRVLPDTKIAVNKLPGVNADLSFYATRIKSVGGLPIDAVALGVQVQNGTLAIKPLRFRTARGDVALDFEFTPYTRDSPPKMHADVDVRHIDLKRLLDRPSEPAMLQQTAGIVGGFIKVDSTGVSTREFLAHMNGDAGFFMENGQVSALLDQLAPIDVLGALGVYLTGGKPVPIDCLVSRFDIKQGVATATTLIFNTNDDTIVGKGNVNFADETIFLDLTPYNRHFTAVSLRTPVDIRGTLKKPAFHLETGQLIARLGAAIGLGIAFPPAALLPLVDTGLGNNNSCARVYAQQQPPGNAQPKSGSTVPEKQ